MNEINTYLAQEIREQKIAHVMHELWSGRVSKYWIKTVSTLRGHYLSSDWDDEAAAKLIRRNIREAISHLGGESIGSETIDIIEARLLARLKGMYRTGEDKR